MFIVFFCLIFLIDNARAQTQSLGGYVVESFDVGIVINEDSSFDVEEKISVFFTEPRHGIFRYIPIKYKDDNGFQHNLRLKLISVVDKNGVAHNVAEKGKQSGNFMIKIGDPNKTISGFEEYAIRYRIENGFRFFDDHSEFFWNPIGTEWDVPINKATVKITFPENVNLRDYEKNFVCYTGPFDSKEQNCSGRFVNSNQVFVSANDVLNSREGLTVAVSLLPDDMQKPSAMTFIGWFFMDNFGFLIPVVVFAIMFCFWWKKGKEINLNKTIIVQYDPPDNLTPGEMGYLLKERYDAEIIAADIVDLAVKGFVEIIESKKFLGKKYELRLKKMDDNKTFLEYQNELLKASLSEREDRNIVNLSEHQEELLASLFPQGKSVIDLSKSNNFHTVVPRLQKKVKKQIKKMGYFFNDIWNKGGTYLVIFITFGFLVFATGVFLSRLDFVFGAISSGIIVFIFSFIMSKKTIKGAEALWHVKGFREYIKTAERYRIKFQEDENLFEKFLPYAMVFGLADKWSKAFDGILKENPDWYHGTGGSSTFNALTIGSFADSFSSQTSSSFAPPSSSSSGFSSGGGFSGGGGGGSW